MEFSIKFVLVEGKAASKPKRINSFFKIFLQGAVLLVNYYHYFVESSTKNTFYPFSRQFIIVY